MYVFVNVKMFKEAGIALPDMDWKYNDFLNIIKKMTKGSGTDKVYGFVLQAVDFSKIFPFFWSVGGDLFTKDKTKFGLTAPDVINKIKEIKGMMDRGLIPNFAQFTSSDDITRWFVNNKVTMRCGYAAEVLSLQKIEGLEFEVYPFPGTAAYPDITVYKSNIVGISSSSKKQEASWEFLEFLRAEGQTGEKLYMQAKRMPPNFDDPELWKIYADPTKSPKNILNVTKAIADTYGHTLPLRSGYIEVQNLVMPEL